MGSIGLCHVCHPKVVVLGDFADWFSVSTIDTDDDMQQCAPTPHGDSDGLADAVEEPLLSNEPNRGIDLTSRSFAGNEKIDVQLVQKDEL